MKTKLSFHQTSTIAPVIPSYRDRLAFATQREPADFSWHACQHKFAKFDQQNRMLSNWSFRHEIAQ
jgi:hypothetical protein